MRAIEILQTTLDCWLQHVHARTRDAVWRGVSGLLRGGKLWLSSLGRSLPGETSDKHLIKAADRLLGSKVLHKYLPDFYRALARRLLRHTNTPVIVVDWSKMGARHYMLSAQLCCDGRSLPLYDQVHPKSKLGNPTVQNKFLKSLATILPPDCKPILLTDAGFCTPWFEAVLAQGWHFVGRIRNRTQVLVNDKWVDVRSLHAWAMASPRNVGTLLMRRKNPREYRVVISKKPKLKGRKRMTSRGRPGNKTVDRRCSSGAREPWILVTSLQCNPVAIIQLYSLRMQIEQSFRDKKNHRHGWGLQHVNSTCSKRLEVLLLIAALAAVVIQTIGRAAARQGLQRNFQANTIRHRRVLSFFVLGAFVVRRKIAIAAADLLECLSEHAVIIAENTPF